MRRPARFFHHFIREDGQIWLDDGQQIVGVEYTAEGWHIDVVEYGRPEQSDGGASDG